MRDIRVLDEYFPNQSDDAVALSIGERIRCDGDNAHISLIYMLKSEQRRSFAPLCQHGVGLGR